MKFPFWRDRQSLPQPLSPVSSASTSDGAFSEEAVLVARAQKGDRTAFDALCELHGPLLRGFVARRVASDMVDDVVQETLLGAWLRIAHFEPQARFKTWLYQIALHKSIDANRARERKGRHEQWNPLDAPDDGEAGYAAQGKGGDTRRPFPLPGERLEAEERRTAILAALDQIPAGQREVVLLYFYAEMTLPEIAQAVGRNLSTVKYQFYAAHVKIADLLTGTPWAVPAASESSSISSITNPAASSASLPRPSAQSVAASGADRKSRAPFERKARPSL